MERILCAAIHYKDGQWHVHQPKNITTGIVVCGRRHHNCIHNMDILMQGRCDKTLVGREGQGFITSMDRFVSRAEAYKIAKAAGQLLLPPKDDDEDELLISEDLY